MTPTGCGRSRWPATDHGPVLTSGSTAMVQTVPCRTLAFVLARPARAAAAVSTADCDAPVSGVKASGGCVPNLILTETAVLPGWLVFGRPSLVASAAVTTEPCAPVSMMNGNGPCPLMHTLAIAAT